MNITSHTLISKTRSKMPEIIYMGTFDDMEKAYEVIKDCGWNLDLCGSERTEGYEVINTDTTDYFIMDNKINEVNDISILEGF